MTFNVQNLFDGINDKQEYDDYRPPQWKDEDYQKRLVSIGKALVSVNIIPDIIAFEEVEHVKVVEDIQRYYFPQLQYIVGTDNKYSATENVLLSKYKILDSNVHSLTGSLAKGTRFILDVKLELPKKFSEQIETDIIQVLVVHLKSKRSSENISSDTLRGLQYKLLSSVIDESIPTIILGDFNDNNPVAHITTKNITQFPLETVHPDVTGTYNYKNEWEQLDHILFDSYFDQILEDEHLQVVDVSPFLTSKMKPHRFIRNIKNFTAISDHLPLLFYADFVE